MATAKGNTKDERIYIRVSGDIRDDFDAVAEYKGLTRSGLLHSLIVNSIHQARKETPEIFTKTRRSDLDDSPAITLDQAREDNSKKRGDS